MLESTFKYAERARPFKYTDGTGVSYYVRGLAVWPALHIFKCRYRICIGARVLIAFYHRDLKIEVLSRPLFPDLFMPGMVILDRWPEMHPVSSSNCYPRTCHPSRWEFNIELIEGDYLQHRNRGSLRNIPQQNAENIYHLVIFNIAMENHHRNRWFTY